MTPGYSKGGGESRVRAEGRTARLPFSVFRTRRFPFSVSRSRFQSRGSGTALYGASLRGRAFYLVGSVNVHDPSRSISHWRTENSQRKTDNAESGQPKTENAPFYNSVPCNTINATRK
jgi:hypothetical protein